MKTAEEIKKALECCAKINPSELCSYACPYHNMRYGCLRQMPMDAIAYINLLEERIRGMQLQMAGDCGVCKHNGDMERCVECLFDPDKGHPLWEYEGFPTDMEKEE